LPVLSIIGSGSNPKTGNAEFRCYFQLATMIIGGKWKPKVLFHLPRHEVVRFGALRRAVFGISENQLMSVFSGRRAVPEIRKESAADLSC
jgi:hypothetical protein